MPPHAKDRTTTLPAHLLGMTFHTQGRVTMVRARPTVTQATERVLTRIARVTPPLPLV